MGKMILFFPSTGKQLFEVKCNAMSPSPDYQHRRQPLLSTSIVTLILDVASKFPGQPPQLTINEFIIVSQQTIGVVVMHFHADIHDPQRLSHLTWWLLT